jgi:hypothetical protein
MAQIKEAGATAEIAPLKPMDEAAALAWLRSQPHGRTNLLPAALGERWGWHALVVGRRLKAWERAGLIKRTRGGKITVVDGTEISVPRLPARPKAAPRPVLVREGGSATPLPAPVVLPSTGSPSTAISLATAVLCIAAYLVAASLAVVAAYFSIRGMIVLFPGAPTAIVAMGVAMEVGKLVSVAFLAHQWRRLGILFRAVLIVLVAGLAAINAVGVYSQLVAAHFGDRVGAMGAVEIEAATIAARIDAQTHALADVDTRLSQIDGAIAEMTKRGRTNGAFDAINSQRKARSELVAQRQREAEVLTGLKTEQAAAMAKAHQVEVEAAPIMYEAQLLGGTTEQAIRWLILAMVLCCDPLAIALTAAASARR